MSIYSSEYKILSSDTDMFRRLRLSRLFTLLQEMAIAHTEALGAGREKTLDKGFLWALTLQEAKVTSLPVYDQKIKLFSAPGEMMHMFFPRHYLITDEDGNELVSCSALWVLMNQKTRAVVTPEDADVFVPGEKEIFWKTFFPAAPALSKGEEQPFTVPFSYTDLNSHMNNTKYFDLAEDLMEEDLRKRNISSIKIEYSAEAALGEEITLNLQQKEDEFLLFGKKEKRIFRLSLKY